MTHDQTGTNTRGGGGLAAYHPLPSPQRKICHFRHFECAVVTSRGVVWKKMTRSSSCFFLLLSQETRVGAVNNFILGARSPQLFYQRSCPLPPPRLNPPFSWGRIPIYGSGRQPHCSTVTPSPVPQLGSDPTVAGAISTLWDKLPKDAAGVCVVRSAPNQILGRGVLVDLSDQKLPLGSLISWGGHPWVIIAT